MAQSLSGSSASALSSDNPSTKPLLSPARVSLEPTTARGQSVPLADATAQHRTTQLRELSRSQPTRRPRYAQPTGEATSGTYSQPVLVRTYSQSTRHRPAKVPRSGAPAISASASASASTTASASSSSSFRRTRRSMTVPLPHPKSLKRPHPSDDLMLPPIDAFTFKSIMAEIEHDISADLDRIAEICARSRYSLSNQYEIHVTPHGSGSQFIQPSSEQSPSPVGPTLQAISSDDEHVATGPVRKRSAVRRRSAAYGTLETIMSSSRSSDEERSKRKSAAEIAAHVRGRVAHQNPDESSSAHSTDAHASSELYSERDRTQSKPRATLAAAILSQSRALRRKQPNPASSLVSQPALPETSHSHLVSTTLSEAPTLSRISADGQQPSVGLSKSTAVAYITAPPEEPRDIGGPLGGFRFSVPWRSNATAHTSKTADVPVSQARSYAEGSLRCFLGADYPLRSGNFKFINLPIKQA
ncbi:hypothetical protein F5Y16DRAFT_367823, partial [Xylariaceae sp. FL0255]